MFASLFEQDDHDAAVQIERLARGFVGRMRARKLANQKYTRFYDSNLNKFYWLDKTTNETTWTVSNWLYQQKIDMPPEDSMLFESQQKIRELEEKLKQKEDEIKQVRKARYEELEPDVIKDKVRNAKSFKRSKDMDLWKTDELAAWFVELKMDFIVDYLFKNRYACAQLLLSELSFHSLLLLYSPAYYCMAAYLQQFSVVTRTLYNEIASRL